ncbi:MAG: serine/threonine protein kinase [Deltaproteobacteria bacterium]|nr:serine/threonine protein kinase [Deltaproteobacteria bacterium]
MSTAGGGFPLTALGPDVLLPGAKAGPWRVERELGRGGMGAVYAVVHDEIGKRAALKVVHRRLLTPAFNVERVMLEAKVVNTVGHPNIVDIFETGSLPDGRPYIVMERLEGQPLAVRADEGKIQADHAIGILLQVCDALIAAHAHGVIHRDLKLDNVFLVDNADAPQSPKVKVLDWGIAKVINHDVRHTVEGQLVGTPQYLSPEQARGANVTPQSDVYSLGVMAYELFLEQLPFEAETSAEIMVMHLKAIPPAPRELWPDIPDQLEELLLRMLAKNPENRPTMLDVARQLEEVRAELDRRRQAVLENAIEVVAIEPMRPRTIIRPPSAGLAPTLPSDSADWRVLEPRTQRWQWALGAAALVVGLVMFLVTRNGDTQAAAAATTPEITQTSTTADDTAPGAPLVTSETLAVRDDVPARASDLPSASPASMPRASNAPVENAARTSTRPSRVQHAPARKAPVAPRRPAKPIDPNGTIDPW